MRRSYFHDDSKNRNWFSQNQASGCPKPSSHINNNLKTAFKYKKIGSNIF